MCSSELTIQQLCCVFVLLAYSIEHSVYGRGVAVIFLRFLLLKITKTLRHQIFLLMRRAGLFLNVRNLQHHLLCELCEWLVDESVSTKTEFESDYTVDGLNNNNNRIWGLYLNNQVSWGRMFFPAYFTNEKSLKGKNKDTSGLLLSSHGPEAIVSFLMSTWLHI